MADVRDEAGRVADLDIAGFERIIGAERPVLVDFWSEFCSPCHAVGQSVAELAQEYAGQLVAGKVDVISQPELARQFGVTSVPVILVFKQGEIVARLNGARPKSHIVRAVTPHLQPR